MRYTYASSDALIVDATLNCLSILVRTRPGTSSRILNALLSFNPLKLANSPMTPTNKVMIKSMEKTTRMLLIHLSRRDPHNPMVPRIQQYVERMMRMLADVFDGSARKRPLETRQPDSHDSKRQRIDASQIQIPTLGAGPHSLAAVFTLIGNDGLRAFDVSQVPAAMVAKIAVNTLARTDTEVLAKAIDGIRGRLITLASAPPPQLDPNTAPLGVDEDEDDYEPDFFPAEDNEQLLNKLDGASSAVEPLRLEDSLGLRAFTLPQPPQITPDLALSAGSGTVTRVLDMMKSLENPTGKRDKIGFARLAATAATPDSWLTILTRLATRSSAGLEDGAVKDEDDRHAASGLGDGIRDVLYNYVMEDFRRNIDVAVSWLCEEWFNDRVLAKAGGNSHRLRYEKCALRLIDGFLPYLHPQDKILTRFLSEIPELSRAILSRVKSMCRDPSVTQLALTSLLYLVMMKPPIKEVALDTVQDIWTDCKALSPDARTWLMFADEDARPMAGKYLTRFRPAFVEAATKEETPTATAIST